MKEKARESHSVPLDQIGVAEMKKFSPHFDEDVAKIFDIPRFASSATHDWALSPENIATQIERWRKLLA